jgi:hypothetical protein
MESVKEILSNNRDSIISSIKWTFKIWKQEDVKVKMIDFLNWAENNEADIFRANEAKNTKTLLKSFVMNMAYEQNRPQREAERKAEEERNIRMFGTAKPKLADLLAYGAEKEEEKGNVWHPIYKTWVKNKGFNPTMKR